MKDKNIIRFNKKAQEWLNFLELIDEDTVLKNPHPKSWSLSELYDHVVKVAITYQIPNALKEMTDERELKKAQNPFAFLLFDLNVLPRLNIKMENFPPDLVAKFTPEKHSKAEVITNFKRLIELVHETAQQLNNVTKTDRTYHPMFGTITAKKWFRLIEIHLRHHDKQRFRILKQLRP
ncbi:MAG: DinB family protein [Winogradskyella sp.]|nr:DinB family protein [Winogradskyella sp.]